MAVDKSSKPISTEVNALSGFQQKCKYQPREMHKLCVVHFCQINSSLYSLECFSLRGFLATVSLVAC